MYVCLHSGCNINRRLFVQKEKNATFIVKSRRQYYSKLYKGTERNALLFVVWNIRNRPHIRFKDDRVNFKITGNNFVTITLKDVIIDNSGMYIYEEKSVEYCWQLFILGKYNHLHIISQLYILCTSQLKDIITTCIVLSL